MFENKGKMMMDQAVKKERNSHICELCQKSFPRRSALEKHIRVHTKERPFSCDVCSKSYSQKGHLKVHKLTHSGKQNLHCPYCEKTFFYDCALKKHVRCLHPGRKPYLCSDCGLEFNLAKDLRRHGIEHQDLVIKQENSSEDNKDSKVHKCTLCGRSFQYMNDYMLHKMKHLEVEPGFFKCDLCGKVIQARLWNYRNHMKFHDETPKFNCSRCDKVFHKERDLDIHTKKHDARTCTICFEEFPSILALKKHMMGHNGHIPDHETPKRRKNIRALGTFPCQECDLVYKQRSELTKHKNREHWRGKNACQQCGKDFRWPFELKAHVQANCNPKPYSCSKCSRRFRRAKEFRDHVDARCKQKPYSCPRCSKEFSQSHHLKVHIQMNCTEKLFSCAHCQKAFRHKSNLVLHMDTVHNPNQIKHKCNLCLKSFSSQLGLQRHVRNHSHVLSNTSVKPFSCHQCTKSFKRKSTLLQHIATVHQNRHFHCTVCDKQFRYTNTLDLHMEVHKSENEKLWACYECGKRFFSLKNLKWHMRDRHRQISGFACSYCKKVLGDRSKLRIHENRHTNNLPFECPQCGCRYPTKISLSHHLAMHTAGTTFICNTCSRPFRSSIALARHKKQQHLYKCGQCPKRFMTQTGIDKHRKVCLPNADSPSQLPVTDTHNLNTDPSLDQRSVSDPQWFSCSQCIGGFVTIAEGFQHIRSHGLYLNILEENTDSKHTIDTVNVFHKKSGCNVENMVTIAPIVIEPQPETVEVQLQYAGAIEDSVKKEPIWQEQNICNVCTFQFTDLSQLQEHVLACH